MTPHDPAPPAARTAVKTYDPVLREALLQYRKQHEIGNKELARLLQTNETMVSKYCNGKPEGDVEGFEKIARDVLHGLQQRRAMSTRICDNEIARSLRGCLEIIRKTGDVGVIYSAAGLGKTSGLKLYLQHTPSAVAAFATPWLQSKAGIEGEIFRSLDTSSWQNNTRRGDYICDRLSGSSRLVVVDDAHLLTFEALRWLFWLHRKAGVPVALIANPELLEVVRKNDQMYSCVGLRFALSFTDDRELRSAVRELLALHAPDDAEALEDLAVQVAAREGHLRALTKQLALAHELRSQQAILADPCKAFIAAHGKLIRGYKLEVSK